MSKFLRWETALSDQEALYFEKLIHENCELVLVFKDQDNAEHRLLFKQFGPYRVVEEAWSFEYWDNQSLGWTFQVEQSTFLASYEHKTLGAQLSTFQHWVMMSMDVVVEVLAPGPPIIETFEA